MDRLRQLATLTSAGAVAVLWFTLYRALPGYPPALELPLAVAAVLFLSDLAFLYRIHAPMWPPLAAFGFIVSACGLGLWLVGGALNALGVATAPESIWARFALELISQPQPGWGLFCVGLIPIGLAAIRSRMPVPVRLLLPVGALFVLGAPLKYILGDRAGGVTVFVGFGIGWLVIGALLLCETSSARESPQRSNMRLPW